MRTMLFAYSDKEESREDTIRRLSHGILHQVDIAIIIEADNTIEVVKNRSGETGQRFTAQQLNITLPDRSINITPKS